MIVAPGTRSIRVHGVVKRYPSLADDPLGGSASLKRVCIATLEFPGVGRSGPVGTAFHALAVALAGGGHDVTVLFLRDRLDGADEVHWRAHFSAAGLRFVHLPRPPPAADRPSRPAETAFNCYRWLSQHRFDIVHFHELSGVGYYSLLAKRSGRDFHSTLLCVGLHGHAGRSSRDGGAAVPPLAELEIHELEKACVQLADLVISPTHHVLDRLRDRRWSVARKAFVHPGMGGIDGAGCRVTRPRQDPDEVTRTWLRWHVGVQPESYRVPATPGPTPRVSVVIVHAHREHDAVPVIESVKNQTTAPHEILVCRIGSDRHAPTTVELNQAISTCSGDYVVILVTPSTVAPTFLSEITAALRRHGDDLVTTISHHPTSEYGPASFPIASAVVLGIWRPFFGSPHVLVIRRATFVELGGGAAPPVELLVWELTVRAALAGKRLSVIPADLAEVPPHDIAASIEDDRRRLALYEATVAPSLRQIVRFSLGLARRPPLTDRPSTQPRHGQTVEVARST